MEVKIMHEVKLNILRSQLAGYNIPYSEEGLYQDFLRIEESAYNTWIPALGHDKGSHSGSTHLKNVELQVCSLLEQTPDIRLTPWETYILLLAILFHDIGRTISESKKRNLKDNDKSAEIFVDHHAYYSYLFIKEAENIELGLGRDTGVIKSIAFVCGAHEIDLAENLGKAGHLDEIFLDGYGRIRVGWLGCLLSLGDELDTSYHRAMPDWVRYTLGEEDLKKATSNDEEEYIHMKRCPVEEILAKGLEKRALREQIRGCEINLEGRLMVVYPGGGLNLQDIEEYPKNPAKKELLKRIGEDLEKKEKLIRFWRNELRQMHLEIYSAAVSIEGQLYSYYNDKIKLTDKFNLTVEPVMTDMKVTRVLDAAVQLRFNSFGKSTFPWETLATEAGIEHLPEAKLIFHRLAMLAFHHFGNKQNKTKLTFTELDGEWTIKIEFFEPDIKESSNINNIQSKIDDARETIQEFYNLISNIVGKAVEEPAQNGTNNESKKPIQKLIVANPDLAYLFDEDAKDKKGIVFPESRSVLFKDNKRPKLGINMVISGPAGVGKSTLAMELIARGKTSEERNVNAYYSLEQPLESIRQLATELGLEDKGIISFHPNPSGVNSPNNEIRYASLYEEILQSVEQKNDPKIDHILLLPNLAPHSYGDNPDEEKLFWFRYKQVARLIEAHRAYQANSNDKLCLSIIVLDNLNAFSHHPLARQRVHQLFKLIAWGGVLGVHIVEQNPSEKFRIFQSEVEALSDIAVHLDWHVHEYRYKTIEVLKSRCQRNVLGIHPFKIRRKAQGADNEANNAELGESIPGFVVFPSLHTQVVSNEKRPAIRKDNKDNSNIGKNDGLKALVHKNKNSSGISSDAFVILSGRSGGHKLALGLDYIHGKKENALGLVLNMGQPILYNAVAGYSMWHGNDKLEQSLEKPWRDHKVLGDCYSIESEERHFLDPGSNSIITLNFQPGFLLPEEFVATILKYFDVIEKSNNVIDRVLFNSTAHLSSRFPLLDKDPLVLTTLVRILKKRDIGLMIIAVEEIQNQERLENLVSMADVKLNIHHLNDNRVPGFIMKKLADDVEDGKHNANARIISSDNVTGKDYGKRYGLLDIDNTGSNKPVLKITEAK
jgi:hypothetical protein